MDTAAQLVTAHLIDETARLFGHPVHLVPRGTTNPAYVRSLCTQPIWMVITRSDSDLETSSNCQGCTKKCELATLLKRTKCEDNPKCRHAHQPNR